MRVLCVNPPIYDFTAYDFWLRPYGMLRVAGKLRRSAEIQVFDYLRAENPDRWGRGRFREEVVTKPSVFRDIPRHFRRFGTDREEFRALLREQNFDIAFVQTVMTYWVLGVKEVIADLREFQPQAKIVLGGVYASICPSHANSLGVDFVLEGTDLEKLWSFLNLTPSNELPFWEGQTRGVGILKLADGCPFRCSYCSVPLIYPQFIGRPTEECLEEFRFLVKLGAQNIAFYDDALLFKPNEILIPFLESVLREKIQVSFHCPNALNARFITKEIAQLMVRAGFKTFFLGFESADYAWQRKTGGKVYSEEFAQAVANLREGGASQISAYLIIGHPDSENQNIEASMEYVQEQGVRIMLSDFAPIPGTPDGEKCRAFTDLDEPLNHNKTAFTIRRLGIEREAQLKNFCRELNSGKLAAKLHSKE